MHQKERIGIGTMSGQTGCNVETIRYYERIGLLPDPPRSEGGHRIYSLEHLKLADLYPARAGTWLHAE